jgi:multimeric flavodoxin WrbA
MKILAICGSPHKGNCYSVLNSIKENYPEIDYKILMLNEVNLEMCKGCYTCVLKGERFCPLKDDRDMIIKEMFDADGVLLASPVFVNHVTALMKNYIDRLGYMGHRPCFYDKYAMVMSICGGFGTEPTNKYMRDIFTSFGFNVVSSLELQVSTKSENEKKLNLEKTINAFDIFIAGIKKGERKPPTLMNLIMFNMFKYVSEVYGEKFKADYQYYKDKTDFPYDGKISFFKKFVAKRVVKKFAKEIDEDR